MIMASHQIFSGQLQHLTGQINFDQTNSGMCPDLSGDYIKVF